MQARQMSRQAMSIMGLFAQRPKRRYAMRIATRSEKRVVLYVAAVLVLLGTFGGRAHAVAHGQYYDYVYKVQIDGNRNFLYISVPGGFSSSHGCSQPSFVRSAYPVSDDRTKAWMQLATTSLLSHTRVYIQTNGCDAGGLPIMYMLQLEQ